MVSASDHQFQAQRSYSIASAPEDTTVSLTIERLEEGEVSPYRCDVLHVGDGLEVRGPIGGYFVWNREQTGRLLLIVGGSGIVPLMAMLRHRARAEVTTRAAVPVRLIYSAHAGPCHLPGRDRAAHRALRPGGHDHPHAPARVRTERFGPTG